jgi:isopentenyl-diphosphate Delta-isomerase
VSQEAVVLVDSAGQPIGTCDKVTVHRTGQLHLAFSIFVFNGEGELLLQRRSWEKYHSPGRWSNTCCSHPRPDESISAAARRRLGEELGFTCDLTPAGAFIYRAEVGHGLVEHEYDHVFVGRWDGSPAPDPAEVVDWRWIDPDELRQEILGQPDRFTPWLQPALLRALAQT